MTLAFNTERQPDGIVRLLPHQSVFLELRKTWPWLTQMLTWVGPNEHVIFRSVPIRTLVVVS